MMCFLRCLATVTITVALFVVFIGVIAWLLSIIDEKFGEIGMAVFFILIFIGITTFVIYEDCCKVLK